MATYGRVQYRRDTATNWSTLNPVLAAGEPGYDTTTKTLKIGDGVTAWNSLTGYNIANTLVDAKGDLLVGTADNVLTRLPVGANGRFLVAESGVSAGVKYTTAGYYEGTGFPESQVIAPVGSVYTDTAATNGAIRWIKATGVTSSGWKVLYGETGRRNVASLIGNSWVAAGPVELSRRGSMVTFQINATNASTTLTPYTIPAGFRPPSTIQNLGASGTTEHGVILQTGGQINPATAQAAIRWYLTWATEEAWPSSLPGTAA